MTDAPGTETEVPVTGTVDVRGRTITIKKLVDTQMMLLAREAKILQRDDIGNDRKLDGIDRMFRILESVVVEPDDKQYLEGLMIEGDLDLRELVSFVTTFNAAGMEKPARVRRARATAKR